MMSVIFNSYRKCCSSQCYFNGATAFNWDLGSGGLRCWTPFVTALLGCSIVGNQTILKLLPDLFRVKWVWWDNYFVSKTKENWKWRRIYLSSLYLPSESPRREGTLVYNKSPQHHPKLITLVKQLYSNSASKMIGTDGRVCYLIVWGFRTWRYQKR